MCNRTHRMAICVQGPGLEMTPCANKPGTLRKQARYLAQTQVAHGTKAEPRIRVFDYICSMEYEELVQDIFRRFPSVQKEGFRPGAYKPGLEGMRDFNRALGNPAGRLRAVHIAGTNGKGSVAAMTASALTAAGYRTGLYTSPHLLDWRERSRIDGTMIPRDYAHAFLERWKPYFERENLSFFEITTGLAFKWFADSGTDFAVIEAGLGGRLDSTNILTPAVSVVTSIGLDHCALLGNTREAIAREKAGIMKPGVPCIVGERDAETAPVFDAAAASLSPAAPLVYADRHVPPLWDHAPEILAAMDLRADVQRKNLRTVLCALEALFPAGEVPEAVAGGIIHTARDMHFHGRWERLRTDPEVIADIGHNAHALQHNFAQLESMMASGVYDCLIIVYAVMADKDLGAILPLMPRMARYIFTAPKGKRPLPAEASMRKSE